MKSFAIVLLCGACLYLLYGLKYKTAQLNQQQAMVDDLTQQLQKEKEAHAADLARSKQPPAGPQVATVPRPAVELPPQPAQRPQPPAAAARVVSPPPPAAPDAAQINKAALDEFAATMNQPIATEAPPIMVFAEQESAPVALVAVEGEAEPEDAFLLSNTQRKIAVTKYNNFVSHVFPDKPNIRVEFSDAVGPALVHGNGQVEISPARLLWVAVDESSPDAKYAIRWMRRKLPHVGVTQTAMATLDQKLSTRQDAQSLALSRNVHDAQAALASLLNGKPASIEDQHQLAFFLRTTGLTQQPGTTR